VRVLVTGGAGYIGSHLVDRCLADGHSVVVLDDLSTGSVDNLAHVKDKVELVIGSITDYETVRRCAKGADLVFHLAAVVGVTHILNDPIHAIRVNSGGTERVLDASIAAGAKLVFASTSEIYGRPNKVPMAEGDERVLGSTDVPRWSYSTAKALDEHLILEHARQGFPASIVRYFNSYGPRLAANGYGSVIASFLGQARAGGPITVFGAGTQTRSFTFVSDTVEGTYQAGVQDAANGLVFNVGDGAETSISQLARIVNELVGGTLEIRYVDPGERFGPNFEDTLRRVPDVTRIRDVLGWSPQTHLTDGLATTWDWWKANRPGPAKRTRKPS
jgi:UDP-glucose 4-epimerase